MIIATIITIVFTFTVNESLWMNQQTKQKEKKYPDINTHSTTTRTTKNINKRE